MERTWNDGLCPDCKQLVKLNDKGVLACACEGKRWTGTAGVEGSAEDKALLEDHGFQFTGDVRGDKYYVGSLTRIVWLYDDGTWSYSMRPPRPGMSLAEFLTETDSISQAEIDSVRR